MSPLPTTTAPARQSATHTFLITSPAVGARGAASAKRSSRASQRAYTSFRRSSATRISPPPGVTWRTSPRRSSSRRCGGGSGRCDSRRCVEQARERARQALACPASRGRTRSPERPRATGRPLLPDRRRTPSQKSRLAGSSQRRGWDSNPRAALTASGFQDRAIRPLWHPARAECKRQVRSVRL